MSYFGFGKAATKLECKSLETASNDAKAAFDKCQSAPSQLPQGQQGQTGQPPQGQAPTNGQPPQGQAPTNGQPVAVSEKKGLLGFGGFLGLGGKKSKKTCGGKKSKSQKPKKTCGGKKSKSQKSKKTCGGKKSRSQKKR
jgi:hypothetical protein